MCVFRCKLRLSHTAHSTGAFQIVRLSASQRPCPHEYCRAENQLVVKRKRAIALFLLSVLNSAVSLAAAFWCVGRREQRVEKFGWRIPRPHSSVPSS